MKRIEHFFVGEKEVSKELWFEVYNDFNNFETLTIKYEDALETGNARITKEIEELKKQVAELQKDRKNWNSTPVYPWNYSKFDNLQNYHYVDWTVRPEHIFVYDVTCMNPNRINFSTTC